jgi:hypothetical protein
MDQDANHRLGTLPIGFVFSPAAGALPASIGAALRQGVSVEPITTSDLVAFRYQTPVYRFHATSIAGHGLVSVPVHRWAASGKDL